MRKRLANYILLERIPQAPIYIFSLGDAGFVNPVFRKLGLKTVPGPELNIFENDDFLFHYNLDSLRECSKDIFDKLVSNPDWGIKLDESIIKTSRKFIEYSQKIEKMDLAKLCDKQLVKINNEWFFKNFHDSWTYGWPAVIVDFERNLFSNHLLGYLKKKISDLNYHVSAGDVFSTLTTPLNDSYAQNESLSLMNLVIKIRNNKKLVKFILNNNYNFVIDNWGAVDKKTWHQFSKHYEQFCWLPFMYVGPVWGREYFLDSIQHLLKQNLNLTSELKNLKLKKVELKKFHAKYVKDLQIHEDFQTLFKVAQRFVYSKSYRKDAMYYGCYVIDKLLREIAKRKFLSVQQVRRLYPWEIESFLLNDLPDFHILNERKFAVQYSVDNHREMYQGEKAREFVANIEFVEQKIEQPKEILGDCASVGKVRGTVKIINSPKEISKMEAGNVLVSYATSPDIMPAIKKAVAIVTDLGGIICHAAIVSRELHIPCVVGTKIATKVLKDGDLVEVDAGHGIVRIID